MSKTATAMARLAEIDAERTAIYADPAGWERAEQEQAEAGALAMAGVDDFLAAMGNRSDS